MEVAIGCKAWHFCYSLFACGKDAAESFESLWHCGAKGHRPDAAETGMA
jgi:hypothetical protein